jgi:nucleotide-binding universal stress UspA family protein
MSGGPQSEQDARLALRIAIAYNARLELVYVVSQVPLLYTTFAEFRDALQSDTSIAAMDPGIVELRRIYGLIKDEGAQVQVVIRTGAVADELVEVCRGGGKRAPADLLVIGAHAPYGTVPVNYLENLAEEIAESAPCPMLVVHAKSEWTEWQISPREAN